MKIVVIGAGIGGLTAAATLAGAGHEVELIERGPLCGGKIGFVNLNGTRCDTGPSLLTMREVFDDLELDLDYREADPAFDYRWDDETTLVTSTGADGFLDAVDATFGSKDRRQCELFLNYCERIWENAAPAFVFADAPRLATVLRNPFKQIRRLSKIDALRSMERAINAQVDNRYLRDIFLRFATYNGSDPRVAPATLNCIADVEIRGGGFGVEGGYYSVVERLLTRCRTLGIVVSTGEEVTRIERSGRRVIAVETESRRVPCDAIVSNSNVAQLENRLLRSESREFSASMSACNAIFRADRVLLPNAHTVFFGSPYLREFASIFDDGELPESPTIYVCNQAVTHGISFENGDSPLFLMINAPPDPAVSTEGIWGRVKERLMRFGIAIDEPLWQRGPAELAELFPGSRGAIYGTSSNDRFAAFQRAPNRHPRFDNLFVASGGAHPGGGVPMCVLSGKAAARALLDNLL